MAVFLGRFDGPSEFGGTARSGGARRFEFVPKPLPLRADACSAVKRERQARLRTEGWRQGPTGPAASPPFAGSPRYALG